LRAVASCSLLVTVAACGGGSALRLAEITPQSVPALEAERAQRPGDASTLTRLGVAQFRANNFAAARQVLDTAVSLDARSGIAAIYLGMTAEAQGDFAAARAAYGRYLEVGRSGELRDAARQRLALVGRRENEYQARQALAREAELSSAPPEPGTIAVMPFSYSGTNQEIAPLTRGLAQLLVTDLARSRQLRVLERERMQAMLDEMRLGAEGRADQATAVRGGRLLRAERVVQGTLADRQDELRVDAAVVDVGTAGVAGTAQGSNTLEQLFELERALVLDLFASLGIQLTDAERQALDQRPTANLQAFLAWSRGLEAEDRGDFTAARQLFDEAQRLDPGFLNATQSAAGVADLQVASVQTVQDVDAVVTQQADLEVGATSEDLRRDALTSATLAVNPTNTLELEVQKDQQPTATPRDRDPTSEATRTEGPKPVTGTVIIIIRRP
jgi:TolB-like protein